MRERERQTLLTPARTHERSFRKQKNTKKKKNTSEREEEEKEGFLSLFGLLSSFSFFFFSNKFQRFFGGVVCAITCAI